MRPTIRDEILVMMSKERYSDIVNSLKNNRILNGMDILHKEMIGSLLKTHKNHANPYDFAIQYARENKLLEVYDRSELDLQSTERSSKNEEYGVLIPLEERATYFENHRNENGSHIRDQINFAHELGLEGIATMLTTRKEHLDSQMNHVNK